MTYAITTNENQPNTTNTNNTPVNYALDLATAVGLELSAACPRVADQVKAAIVTSEINKRSEAIIKGLDKLDSLQRADKKIKPDMVQYDTAGTVISENWSKAKLDEKNKSQATIRKLTSAINKALGNGDFGDLTGIMGADTNGKKDKVTSETE